jgi:hypothetical protein
LHSAGPLRFASAKIAQNAVAGPALFIAESLAELEVFVALALDLLSADSDVCNRQFYTTLYLLKSTQKWLN